MKNPSEQELQDPANSPADEGNENCVPQDMGFLSTLENAISALEVRLNYVNSIKAILPSNEAIDDEVLALYIKHMQQFLDDLLKAVEFLYQVPSISRGHVSLNRLKELEDNLWNLCRIPGSTDADSAIVERARKSTQNDGER